MEIDEIKVCSYCAMIALYDDASGLDYDLSEEEASARYDDILNGLSELESDGYLTLGNSDNDEEFSTTPCEICGCNLAGERFSLNLVKN